MPDAYRRHRGTGTNSRRADRRELIGDREDRPDRPRRAAREVLEPVRRQPLPGPGAVAVPLLLVWIAGACNRAPPAEAPRDRPEAASDLAVPTGSGGVSVSVAEASRLLRLGDTAGARELLAGRLERSPADAGALFHLGLSYHREKRYALARPLFERVVESGTGTAWYGPANHFLGWCLYFLGELDGARHAFDCHLELDPDSASSLHGRARVAIASGELAVAEASLRRGIESESAGAARARVLAGLHERLGDVHDRMGHPVEARSEWLRAFEFSPDDPSIAYKLHRSHAEEGDGESAARYLEVYRRELERRIPGALPPG